MSGQTRRGVRILLGTGLELVHVARIKAAAKMDVKAKKARKN